LVGVESLLDDDRLEPVAIVVLNAVPFVGVLAWGWNLGAIMLLYWLENGVVGLLNVPKLVLAAKTGEDSNPGPVLGFDAPTVLLLAFLVGFFGFHYGAFWFVHGVFVLTLFVLPETALVLEALPLVLVGLVALAVQRTYESYDEFYRSGAFREVTPKEQMRVPYKRVVALHVTLVLGGFVVSAGGSPVGALLILVVAKTGYDLGIWAAFGSG